MIFQGMFAVITPALITGAFAERMKFSTFLAFGLLWATFIYDPLAHWVWGKGWIGSMGALDFAGGTVVHISSGVSALVCAIVVGRRRGFPTEYMAPHNLPFTVTGAALLWVGWFGFNAGSALAADGIAANAFVTTNTASAAADLELAGRGMEAWWQAHYARCRYWCGGWTGSHYARGWLRWACFCHHYWGGRWHSVLLRGGAEEPFWL